MKIELIKNISPTETLNTATTLWYDIFELGYGFDDIDEMFEWLNK